MRRLALVLLALLALLALVAAGGCTSSSRESSPGGGAGTPRAPSAGSDGNAHAGSPPPLVPATPPAEAPAVPSGAATVVVAFLGDSLTAGYGVAPEEAWPALVASLLGREGLPIRALNAGVSGDTTAGALRRLDWVLRQHPGVVVVALGANDGLRGLPVKDTESNLRAIIQRCKADGARVLLVGMLVPPSYGREYFESFRALYRAVARDEGVPLVPFLLEGVALVPELNIGDGIHPNAKGHERLAETVLPDLRSVLKGLPARR